MKSFIQPHSKGGLARRVNWGYVSLWASENIENMNRAIS